MHYGRGFRLKHGAMLDRLAHVIGAEMRRLLLALGLFAAGAAIAAMVIATRATGAGVGAAVAVPAARAAPGLPPHVAIAIHSAAEARASVARAPFAAGLGLTAEEIAAT